MLGQWALGPSPSTGLAVYAQPMAAVSVCQHNSAHIPDRNMHTAHGRKRPAQHKVALQEKHSCSGVLVWSKRDCSCSNNWTAPDHGLAAQQKADTYTPAATSTGSNTTVMLKPQDALLPEASVPLHATAVEPTGSVAPGAGRQVMAGGPQLSVAAGRV